jgi:hypothetical protein
MASGAVQVQVVHLEQAGAHQPHDELDRKLEDARLRRGLVLLLFLELVVPCKRLGLIAAGVFLLARLLLYRIACNILYLLRR